MQISIHEHRHKKIQHLHRDKGMISYLLHVSCVLYLSVESLQVVFAHVGGLFTDGAFCSLQSPSQFTTNRLKPLEQLSEDTTLLQSVCDQ